MAGRVRAKGKCPCGGTWGYDRETPVCLECGREPSRDVFIDVWWEGKRHKIYSDIYGQPFDSPRRALRWLERIRGDIENKTFDPVNYRHRKLAELRFDGYAERWLAIRLGHVERGELRRASYDTYANSIRRHLIPHLGHIDTRAIRGSHIEELAGKLAPKLSRSTLRTVLQHLRTILRDAYQWGDVEKVPKFPRQGAYEPEIEVISREDQLRVVEKMRRWQKPFFTFLIYHPVRQQEAAALQWGDLDFEAWQVHIQRTWSGRGKKRELKPRKAGKAYILPVHRQMRTVLTQMRDEHIQKFGAAPHPTAFIFLQWGGEPFSNHASSIWTRTSKRAGVPVVPLKNGTRHSTATDAVRRGVGLDRVSKALGHTTMVTAQKFYIKYSPETLESVIDPLDVPATGDRPSTVPGSEGPR